MARREALIPKAAESDFATLCFNGGAVAQKVSEDENGWDYLVELPEVDHQGPADEQPAWKTFYVQVKSTTGKRPRIADLSLSNARKMAQKPDPWFVVLYHRPERGTHHVYASHIWEPFISRCLRAVRTAELQRLKLNKEALPIAFGSGDYRGDGTDLINWMEQRVKEVGNDYHARKAALYKSVGHEDGYGRGSFTVSVASRSHLDRVFLGLESIEVADFEMVPERFGIADPARAFRLGRGTLTVLPKPVRIITVMFREQGTSRAIALAGEVIANPLAQFDLDSATLVRTPVAELLLSADGGCRIRFSLRSDCDYEMTNLEKFLRLRAWMAAHAVTVEFIVDGKTIARGEVAVGGEPRSWLAFAEGVARWNMMCGTNPAVTGSDLMGASRHFVAFNALLDEDLLRLETSISPALPVFSRLIYSLPMSCGGICVLVIASRPLVRDESLGDGRIRLDFGPPEVLEVSVMNDHENKAVAHAGTFQKHLKGSSVSTIGIENMLSLVLQPTADFVCHHHEGDSRLTLSAAS